MSRGSSGSSAGSVGSVGSVSSIGSVGSVGSMGGCGSGGGGGGGGSGARSLSEILREVKKPEIRSRGGGSSSSSSGPRDVRLPSCGQAPVFPPFPPAPVFPPFPSPPSQFPVAQFAPLVPTPVVLQLSSAGPPPLGSPIGPQSAASSPGAASGSSPGGMTPVHTPRSAATSSTHHECRICGKTFSRPSGLSTHALIHTGHQPYACDAPNCGKRFNVKSNLMRHRKIHAKWRDIER